MAADSPNTASLPPLDLAETVGRIERRQAELRRWIEERDKLADQREEMAAEAIAGGQGVWLSMAAFLCCFRSVRGGDGRPAPCERVPAMTPEALRASLARVGGSQSGAARLLGVRVTTMQRRCQGEREIPAPAGRLIWAMECGPTLMAALRGRAEATAEEAA